MLITADLPFIKLLNYLLPGTVTGESQLPADLARSVVGVAGV